MTAYMFRLMFLTFFKEFRGTEEQKHHLHESGSLITIPLIILAILATFGGLISLPGNSWLNEYLAPLSQSSWRRTSFRHNRHFNGCCCIRRIIRNYNCLRKIL
jgi:NADH:ubiquinone oxidoreductase subunit 5 (subunit L)/multisubunit Na+/H+ antiporter MnhA subunit